MTDRLMQFLAPAAFVVVLAFNYLAATGALNGTDTAAISNKYPTQITPSGYAFTIWSLIYVGLAAFSIYQAMPAARSNSALKPIRLLFVLSCAANAAWLVAWHFDLIPLSLVIMLILLAILALTCVRVSTIEGSRDILLIRAPFNLYFGWITVATILNATIALVALGTETGAGWGAYAGAGLIIAAAALGVFIRFFQNAFLYPIAIAWGVTAIAVKQSGNTPVVVAAAIAVIVLLFAALWGAVKD